REQVRKRFIHYKNPLSEGFYWAPYNVAAGVPNTIALDGAFTPAGLEISAVGKQLAGAHTPSGVIIKATSKRTSGASTPAGALAKAIIKMLAGAFTPAGAEKNA